MEALIAFGAALLTLRLSGLLAARWRERRSTHLLAWSAGLAAYALGTAAIAWGSAAGWNDGVFRAYYLFGGLLTAPLLGAGSLLGVGVRIAGPVVLVYAGLAAGVAVAEPLAATVSGTELPEAQEYLDFLPGPAARARRQRRRHDRARRRHPDDTSPPARRQQPPSGGLRPCRRGKRRLRARRDRLFRLRGGCGGPAVRRHRCTRLRQVLPFANSPGASLARLHGSPGALCGHIFGPGGPFESPAKENL